MGRAGVGSDGGAGHCQQRLELVVRQRVGALERTARIDRNAVDRGRHRVRQVRIDHCQRAAGGQRVFGFTQRRSRTVDDCGHISWLTIGAHGSGGLQADDRRIVDAGDGDGERCRLQRAIPTTTVLDDVAGDTRGVVRGEIVPQSGARVEMGDVLAAARNIRVVRFTRGYPIRISAVVGGAIVARRTRSGIDITGPELSACLGSGNPLPDTFGCRIASAHPAVTAQFGCNESLLFGRRDSDQIAF